MKKFGYDVEINQRTLESERSDEPYGPWSDVCDNTLEGIKPSNNKYPDVTSIHEFKRGDKVYLVWLEYSTGDSFGSSSRGSTESVGLFKDEQVAEELVRALELSDNNDLSGMQEKYKFNCTTSDGQVFEYGFMPWSGYFESLDEVHCTLIKMG